MHTIHFDRDHVDKIREAAMRRVDFDTDTYRPSVLRKINLQATTSPRKQKKKNEIPKKPTNESFNNNNMLKQSEVRRRPKQTSAAARRRARVQKAEMLVNESNQYLNEVQSNHLSSKAEIKLAMSLRNSQNVLLRSYKKSIKNLVALEAEQKEWRNQSPSKRGVNASPKGTWSTKRGSSIKSLTKIPKSRNPPAFKSDNLLLLSPHTSKRSTSSYGTLIAGSPGYSRVEKTLYF